MRYQMPTLCSMKPQHTQSSLPFSRNAFVTATRAFLCTASIVSLSASTLFAQDRSFNEPPPVHPLPAPSSSQAGGSVTDLSTPPSAVLPTNPATNSTASASKGSFTLSALVLVDSPEKVGTAPADTQGVVLNVNGLPAPDTLTAALQPLLGKSFTVATLQRQVSGLIARHYGSQDRPVVAAYIPENAQPSATQTVATIVVVESRLGAIVPKGNRYFSDHLIQRNIRLQPGDLITASTLKEDVQWINQNPFRSANLVYEKGKEPGTTDLVVEVNDRFPVRPYTGYENNGNSTTGKNRWFGGFNWGNAFLLDHQLGYRFTSTNHTRLYQSHSYTYSIPLPNRDTLYSYGSHTETQGDLPAPLNQNGLSIQFGTRYIHALPVWD